MDLKKLDSIKRDAKENNIPIILDETLNVIKEYLLKIKPKTILEIGTAVGYSASQFVNILDGNVNICTIEKDKIKAETALKNFSDLKIAKNINLICGDATNILPTINDKYDAFFIDANKSKYEFFLNQCLRLSHKGSIIFADNVLYKGYVLGMYTKHKQRTAVTNLRKYLIDIVVNDNLESYVLNTGDGLAISIVK